MLVEKLKESDQMLELAFEENEFQSKQENLGDNYNPFAPPPEENTNQNVLTDEMIEVSLYRDIIYDAIFLFLTILGNSNAARRL